MIHDIPLAILAVVMLLVSFAGFGFMAGRNHEKRARHRYPKNYRRGAVPGRGPIPKRAPSVGGYLPGDKPLLEFRSPPKGPAAGMRP